MESHYQFTPEEFKGAATSTLYGYTEHNENTKVSVERFDKVVARLHGRHYAVIAMGVTGTALDPRSVANLMLDEADRFGMKLTNLALQKLLYFAHGVFLNERKQPLVSGYFEAWQYGPVHPAAYKSFKEAGSGAIGFRAQSQDVLTGQLRPIASATDPEAARVVQRVLLSYGRLPPGRLVDVSHAKNSPWSFVVDKSRTSVAFGLRIPDSVILERFKFHKVAIGAAPAAGEPSEDTPFT